MMMSMKRARVQTGSFNTAYFEAGNPSGPTLVLLHDGAFGASGEISWGSFLPFVETEYHVFAPDLLGWGGSDKVAYFDRAPYAPRVEQLADFCVSLGIANAIFMGVSFGASVLLRWAVDEHKNIPAELVVALSGTGGPYRRPEGLEALGHYDPPSREAMEEIVQWLVECTDGLEEHIESRFESSMIPGHWEATMAPRLKNPVLTPSRYVDTFLTDLSRVTVPIVYVEGRRDRLLEPGWSKNLAEKTPGSRREVLDSGHEPNLDHPGLLHQVFRKIVAERGRS